jgi:hypothetical protein
MALGAAWFLDGRDSDTGSNTGDPGTGAVTTAAPDSTDAVATTVVTTTVAPPDGGGATDSTAATTTTTSTTTTTTLPEPRFIPITVGVDDGPERLELIGLGAEVEISIVNPQADDEFHLHGYDLGDGLIVPAGETAVLRFVADEAGVFELESHITNDVYVRLVVE